MVLYFELSPRTNSLITNISTPFIYSLILPSTAVYHSIRYLIVGPPFPSWTLRHYLTINLRRVFYQCAGYRRVPSADPEERIFPPSAVKHTKECNVTQLECPPISSDVPRLSVVRATQDLVAPVPVPGWFIQRKASPWYPSGDLTRPAQPNERVVFFIVGGGYSGGHPLRLHTPWSIAKLTGARVFCVNYRKSLSKHTAFPASLIDCLAGYQYLLSLNFLPKNIMLCGDSAGANACMALARYLGELRDEGSFTEWGQVGSMCLHSPWSDFTASSSSISQNKYNDHLPDMTLCPIPSHTRHFPTTSPYFSPALPTPIPRFSHLVTSGTKVYISGGTAEAFYNEILGLHEGMKQEGVDVRLRELEGATHSDFVWLDRDIPSMGWSWEVLSKDFLQFWEATA